MQKISVTLILSFIFFESMARSLLLNFLGVGYLLYYTSLYGVFLFGLIGLRVRHKFHYSKNYALIFIFYLGLGVIFILDKSLSQIAYYYLIAIVLFYLFTNFDSFYVKKIILYIGVINSIYIFGQVLFPNEILFLHQNYTDEFYGVDSDLVLRPIGIFSNTVYLSVFQIIIITLIFSYRFNKWPLFLIGLSFGYYGSLVTVVGSIVSFFMYIKTGKNAIFIFSILLGFLLYGLLSPELFMQVFNFDTFVRSVYVRSFGSIENNYFQSFLGQGNIYSEYIGFITIVLFVLILVPVFTNIKFILFSIFLPLMLHKIYLHPLYTIIFLLVSERILKKLNDT